MVKVPTRWSSNPNKNVNVPTYSSSSVTYSSSTTSYSSPTVGLDDFNKVAGIWTKVSKNVSKWQPNPAANTNLYTYDSATKTYDSLTDTYDGIVSGQNFGDKEVATVWRAG